MFYDKESVKFPTHYFQVSKKNFISKANNNVVKHALYSNKERYNKPIRIPVRMVQII